MPRLTGEVRVGLLVTVRKLACRQAAAHLALRRIQVNAPQVRALDPVDPVVPRQALVQEGEVGIDELADRPLLAQHGLEQHLGLGAHRGAQLVVEVREALAVGLDALQRPQLQPLAGEVARQLAGARVAQHALRLCLEVARVAQLAGARRLEQLLVGHRAPQEVREARGELEAVEVGAAQPARRRADRAQSGRGARRASSATGTVWSFLSRLTEASARVLDPRPRAAGARRARPARARSRASRVRRRASAAGTRSGSRRPPGRRPRVLDEQVAVALVRVGVVGFEVVVDELGGEAPRPGLTSTVAS